MLWRTVLDLLPHAFLAILYREIKTEHGRTDISVERQHFRGDLSVPLAVTRYYCKIIEITSCGAICRGQRRLMCK